MTAFSLRTRNSVDYLQPGGKAGHVGRAGIDRSGQQELCRAMHYLLGRPAVRYVGGTAAPLMPPEHIGYTLPGGIQPGTYPCAAPLQLNLGHA